MLLVFYPFIAQAFEAKPIATGFTYPWGMAFISTDVMIVTERVGKVSLVNVKTGKVQVLSGLPADIVVMGQGGLLDVQVDPDFANNAWLYFSYAQGTKKAATTRVARAKLNGKTLEQWQTLLTATPRSSKGQHFGSRLYFDSKGLLYITIGDRGERNRAQKLDDHAGKLLRIHKDGNIPDDNPFAIDNNPNTLGSIYSYGHRNPQGLYIDQQDSVWVQEHGPRGGDELNLVLRGKNYGWPIITYGKEYWGPSIGEGASKEGMEQPKYYYVPSIAPSGLIKVVGNRYPTLANSFLLGALKDRHINVLTPEDLTSQGKALKETVFEETVFEEKRIIESLNKRIRDIEQGKDGLIYFITDEADGALYLLMP
ncbi:PQQ-dependent sugar dehydrogenase [Marinomonas agarivorans]|nr:PQQ-dependent sugar dehydrogenase [Marinomonas agarivorans]